MNWQGTGLLLDMISLKERCRQVSQLCEIKCNYLALRTACTSHGTTLLVLTGIVVLSLLPGHLRHLLLRRCYYYRRVASSLSATPYPVLTSSMLLCDTRSSSSTHVAYAATTTRRKMVLVSLDGIINVWDIAQSTSRYLPSYASDRRGPVLAWAVVVLTLLGPTDMLGDGRY